MPKRLTISLFLMFTLASLLLVAGCGSDNGGAAPRVNPIDVVSGNADAPGSGPGNSLGGGGGTGACVVSMSGTVIACYGGIDQTACNRFASGGATGNFSAGQTCPDLGYSSCQSISGYTLCH